MRLVLLGSTGYHPSDRRHTACLLLPEQGVMLDAGTGMYRAARWLQTRQLDIFLTHAHLDHVVGLTYLFSVVRQHPLDDIRVHALPEKIEAIAQHLLAEPLFPARLPCRFLPLGEHTPLPGQGQLTAFPVAHPGGALGFRLDWPGHSLAYVTDTTADPHAPYLSYLRNVDLLVHECYFGDAEAELARRTGHSHTTAVAQLARSVQAGRLVLVHTDPTAEDDDPVDLPAARAIFPNTQLGYDLLELEF